MINVSVMDQISYLIARKFPGALINQGRVSIVGRANQIWSIEDGNRCLSNVKEFVEKLRKLPKEELDERVVEERIRHSAEVNANAEKREQIEFFNQPYADADYTRWSKAAYWTLDEATALSLGKAPEIVNWENLKSLTQVSNLAQQYEQRRKLAFLYKLTNELSDRVRPNIYLAWAKRNEISYPLELEAQVKACGHVVADLKSRYDELDARFEEYRTAAEIAFDEKDGEIATLTQERDTLRERAREFFPRERRSVLFMINAMAKHRYNFDMNSKRNTATAKISTHLALEGTRLKNQTVLGWLQKAHEYSQEHRQL